MISIRAWSKEKHWLTPETLEELDRLEADWCWVDYFNPTEEEVSTLTTYFQFHHLAIEDCLHWLQRPKMDHYGSYNFFVMHVLDPISLDPLEVNMFVGNSYVVTFHREDPLKEMDVVRSILEEEGVPSIWKEGNLYVAYLILDVIVDGYFPDVFSLEDRLREFDDLDRQKNGKNEIQMLYAVRGDLFKIRRTVHGMGDMMYRLLHDNHANRFTENRWYFENVYDHLLKLGEIIDANREMTSDLRDSLISLHSDRMNRVMTLLTIITTIFIPITFIAGVYGMNFKYMPETAHPYGYYAVLGIMALIGTFMYHWFKRNGWFDI